MVLINGSFLRLKKKIMAIFSLIIFKNLSNLIEIISIHNNINSNNIIRIN